MEPNTQEILRQTELALERVLEQKRINDATAATLGPAIINALRPVLENGLKNMNVTVTPNIQIPKLEQPTVHVTVPEIKVPAPEVTVKVPPIKVPKPEVIVKLPANVQMNKKLDAIVKAILDQPTVNPTSMFDEVNFSRPLPVILTDHKGKPYIAGGGEGGAIASPIIRFMEGTASRQVSSINPLPVTGSLTVTPGAVFYASDAVGSMNMVQVAGNPIAVDQGVSNGGTQRVVQASDAVSSVYVTGFNATVAATILNGDGVARDSWLVSGITNTVIARLDSPDGPYSTSNPLPVVVSGGANTTAAALVDSGGIQYSGSNPLPITGPVVVTGITNTVAAAQVDSSGVAYSGSNPAPVTIVSGGNTSMIAVGDTPARTADAGAAPLKVGGIARTTQPTAYADGDRTNWGFDKMGRGLNRPLQVRELTMTAYATLSTGSETTLLAAIAGEYHDPIMIIGTNTSTAAIQVDLRAVTGGNIVMTWMIPASTGPIGLSLPVGWPQDATGNNWTIDMGDFTNTNVYFSALFSKEL